ncbi:MAG: PsiF family protein [Rhizobacter sp.]
MKHLMSVLALSTAALSLPAFAAPAKQASGDANAPAVSKRQSKMGACNAEAGDKKGDERKAFMKHCLSAKPTTTTQQSKMTTCNKEATGKKGDERKAFMKECLSA